MTHAHHVFGPSCSIKRVLSIGGDLAVHSPHSTAFLREGYSQKRVVKHVLQAPIYMFLCVAGVFVFKRSIQNLL